MVNLSTLVKKASRSVYGDDETVTTFISDSDQHQVVTSYRGHSDTLGFSTDALQSADEHALLTNLISHFTNFRTSIDQSLG